MGEQFKILSLTGGGVRGLYTISILATIEEELAERSGDPDLNIADHFSLICGTSIGGILALGLASGINAREMFSILDNNRKKIFPKGCLPIFKFFKQLFSSIYSTNPLKEILVEHFKDKQIGSLQKAVVITGVNGTTGLPKMFKTPHHETLVKDYKKKLVDVALATSAAPTYFNPYIVEDSLMIDGGLVANSPAFVAYHEATHFMEENANDVYILSIGTMGSQTVLKRGRFNAWGILNGWGKGRRLIELILSSSEGLHNFLTKQVIEERFIHLDESNAPEQSKIVTLDNSSDEAARILRGRGKDQGQYALGRNDVMQFFEKKAECPTFYKQVD